jgi:hypothetical protein
VVVGIGVRVEQAGVERRRDRRECRLVAAFGDVGDREQRATDDKERLAVSG